METRDIISIAISIASATIVAVLMALGTVSSQAGFPAMSGVFLVSTLVAKRPLVRLFNACGVGEGLLGYYASSLPPEQWEFLKFGTAQGCCQAIALEPLLSLIGFVGFISTQVLSVIHLIKELK